SHRCARCVRDQEAGASGVAASGKGRLHSAGPLSAQPAFRRGQADPESRSLAADGSEVRAITEAVMRDHQGARSLVIPAHRRSRHWQLCAKVAGDITATSLLFRNLTLHRDAEVRSRRADEPMTTPAVAVARDAYAGKLLP